MEPQNREGEEGRRPERRVDTSSPVRVDIPRILLRIRQFFRRPLLHLVGTVAGVCILVAVGLGFMPVHPAPPAAASPESEVLAHASATLEARYRFPVELNDRVKHWMERFTGSRRPDFELFLQGESRCGELIRQRLEQRGLPEELLYFAMIESAFSPRAVSSASAVGVWQFTGTTARSLGLRVDTWVDERKDPVRSTDAALDYLERLYDRFGSWYLAAAAYNAGPTRVARILRQEGNQVGGEAGSEAHYWEILGHLPPETREYVPKVLAITLLSQELAGYDFDDFETAKPYRFEQVWVPAGTSINRVARTLGLPVATIRELNPHLVKGITPPGGTYAVRVPPGRGSDVVAGLGPWVGGTERTALADD